MTIDKQTAALRVAATRALYVLEGIVKIRHAGDAISELERALNMPSEPAPVEDRTAQHEAEARPARSFYLIVGSTRTPWCDWSGCVRGMEIGRAAKVHRCSYESAQDAAAAVQRLQAEGFESVSYSHGPCPSEARDDEARAQAVEDHEPAPVGTSAQYSMVWRDGSSLWHVQKNGSHFYETASFEDALQCCKDQDDFAGELSVKWPDVYVPANPRHAEITLSLRAKADSDARDMAAIPSADDVARAVLVIDGNEELSDWVREFLNREDMRADDVDRVRGTCRAIMEEAELAIPSAEALKASRMNDAAGDVLAALEAMVRKYAAVDDGYPGDSPAHQARAAIAKAKGE